MKNKESNLNSGGFSIMETYNKQSLRNPDIDPTSDVIALALGEVHMAYMKFINELANHDIQLEWCYYKDGNAWLAKGLYKWTGVRGGKNEKMFFGYRFGKVFSR